MSIPVDVRDADPTSLTSTAERAPLDAVPLASGELAVVGPLPKDPEAADRSHEVFRLWRDPETYEVTIESDLTIDDYEAITPRKQMEQLRHYAEEMRGKSVVFVNATMEGGGVAMLRPTLIHLLRQLGVDAHWYVMEKLQNPQFPGDNPYDFTKQMHNITQRRTDQRINDVGKDCHRRWSEENQAVLTRQETIQTADIIVVDDPQPARLIRPFKAINPTAKIGWRNHIDNDRDLMADPNTPQGEVWRYWRDDCGVGEVDFCVFHPDVNDAFVPYDIAEKTYLAPATVDEFDDLNKPLTSQEVTAGIGFINQEIEAKNAELIAAGRHEDVISLLNPNRRRITLIARFDESKGMDVAMDMGVQLRRKMRTAGVPDEDIPEVVIVGNGSIDDPSGPKMYEAMLEQRRQYPDEKDGIILMRLKHNYQAMNALMCVTDLGMQTSYAEGCETRITDGEGHGMPMLIAKVGGMTKQVKEGVSGHIVDYDLPRQDVIEDGANWMFDLMTNQAKFEAMRLSTLKAYKEFNSREYSTVANAIRWMRVCGNVLANRPADKHWQTSEFDLAA